MLEIAKRATGNVNAAENEIGNLYEDILVSNSDVLCIDVGSRESIEVDSHIVNVAQLPTKATQMKAPQV